MSYSSPGIQKYRQHADGAIEKGKVGVFGLIIDQEL